jgi:hypothetical protein
MTTFGAEKTCKRLKLTPSNVNTSTFGLAFTVPVYVGTQTQLAVYALKSTLPPEVSAQLKVSPSSLNFGSVKLDTNKSKSVTLKSPGGKNVVAIVVEGLSTTGPFSTSECAGTIMPGQKCKLTVTFDARQAGASAGT